jgi:hypothetical protein
VVWGGLCSGLGAARIVPRPPLCGDRPALWPMAMALLAGGGDGDSLLGLGEILWRHSVVLEVVMGDEEEVRDQIGGKMLEVEDSKGSPRQLVPPKNLSQAQQTIPIPSPCQKSHCHRPQSGTVPT